jgi:hypothetical protein
MEMNFQEFKTLSADAATSIANSAKVKRGANFEKEVESLLKKYRMLPAVTSLKGSPFKTKYFPNILIDENGNQITVHSKLTDFYVPKYNLLVEVTTGISDTKEKEFYVSKQSVTLDPSKYEYVVFVQNRPADIMADRLKHANVNVIYGLQEIEKWISNKSIQQILTKPLNVGQMEYHKVNDLIKNVTNREIDWEHVWSLVDSILTILGKSKVQVGLIRPFTALKVDGKVVLVDAHHLREAVKIVRDFYGYEIDEVPVMILQHLNGVHPEEVTQLMSSINVIVKNWDNFSYVKAWKTTFESTGNEEKLFPYDKLMNDMKLCAKELGSNDPDKGGVILQSYCIESKKAISNFGENLNNMRTGNLSFNQNDYDRVQSKILEQVLILVKAINDSKEALKPVLVGGKLQMREGNTMITRELPSAKAVMMRQFATSLKSLWFTNPEDFESVINNVDAKFWTKMGLPTPKTETEFNRLDLDTMFKFPSKPNEMKVFVEGETVFNKSGNYISKGRLVERAHWVN